MATAEQQAKSKAKPKGESKDKPESAEPPARPVDEIVSDIDQTRDRLVSNLEQLKAETTPDALKGKAEAKVRSVMQHEDGSVRMERVAMIAGAVVALLLVRKGLKARARKKELRALAQVVWVPVPRASVNPEIADLARNAKELAPLTSEYEPQLAVAGA